MGTRKPAVPLTPEQRAFAAKNTKLIHGYLNRNTLPHYQDMDYDDWYGVAAEGYIKAVHYWFCKPEIRGKYAFSTIAHKCMLHEIGGFVRKRSSKCCQAPGGRILSLDALQGDDFSLYDQISDGTDFVSDLESLDITTIMYVAISRLPEFERKIIRMYFFEGLNQKEIGITLGKSQPQVSRLRRGAIKSLKAHYNNILDIG